MKMGVLSNLEPKKVFYYFEEITKIPHGSGNVEQISDFLVDFAKAHKLFYIQDAMKNVIMVKEATPGYENEPVVILQGHMDMVAVQTPDCTMDMKTEGLKVGIDGDSVYAENTSLGGDDGIAVAYALALLDSEDIRHPRLEVIITVDEEVGMDGAREIDLSMLQGHRMINLDSEDEGIFLTSCAGGARVNCRFPMKKQELTGVRYEVEVSGLLGGHSGGEIHKERGNSNCILGRLLWKLSEKMPVGLVSADGGLGRWVAMIRWIPAALANCARRQIDSSTSPGHTIIRSASSSTIMTICGIFFGASSPSGTGIVSIFLLYPFRSRTL